MERSVNQVPTQRPGFWSPLWEAGPRLRDSIVHDPVRRTRIKALLLGEVTILVTAAGFDWFLCSHAIPFNVWTTGHTWRTMVCGFYFFALSYVTPAKAMLVIYQKHFQRGVLLLLLWILALQLLTAALILFVILLSAYPHFFWSHPYLREILLLIRRGGPWGMLAASLLWIGPVAAILFYFKHKWQREMKDEIARRTHDSAHSP